MKHDIKVGTKQSLYRNGDMIRQAKLEKQDWSNTWFLQGEIKKTISCSVTPGGNLKRRLEKVINVEKRDTKVIEDGGIPIHCGLRIKDPLRPPGCVFGDPLCMVKDSQQCDKMGVIYQIQCSKCLED